MHFANISHNYQQQLQESSYYYYLEMNLKIHCSLTCVCTKLVSYLALIWSIQNKRPFFRLSKSILLSYLWFQKQALSHWLVCWIQSHAKCKFCHIFRTTWSPLKLHMVLREAKREGWKLVSFCLTNFWGLEQRYYICLKKFIRLPLRQICLQICTNLLLLDQSALLLINVILAI